MDAKENSMESAANLARRHIESTGNYLAAELSAYSDLTEDSLIIIADTSGGIIVSTPLPHDYLEKNHISKDIISNILHHGKIDHRFQTLDNLFSSRHLIYALPVHTPTGEIFGVLFFCSSSTVEYTFVNQVITTIILSCLWVLVAAMVIVYFITEKIVSPVRDMSKAAKSFALGHFDARVPVTSNRDEIGELAEAFNNMAASLEVNEERQRDFFSNVSHDLRTPMTSISGFVNSILDGTIPPDKHEHYLTIVSAETDRLKRLVYTLFDITKIEAGERKFNKTNFDVCETARLVLISLEKKIDEKNLEIEFECDGEDKNAKIYVYADSDAIHQILQNLLENAIKFTPEKGFVRINIADAGDKAQISVYNTGEGIPSDDLPYVFDRFYKSDRSRGLDKTGAGLGLFIVKRIIDAHEEKIRVASEQDKYCEFIFTLRKTR
jgi:signal transduction histidine kinase